MKLLIRVLLIYNFVICWAFGLAADECLPRKNVIRAVHLIAPKLRDFELFNRALTNFFVPAGVNMLILEIDYRYEWKSHPELRDSDCLSRQEARKLYEICSLKGIKLVPLFNCLGHQSWGKVTFPLLKRYPDFDETPWISGENSGIYCRSWCASNPALIPIVKDLLSELVVDFSADTVHVGMDEVFLIGESNCVRCAGKDKAELFARAVGSLHKILVNNLGVRMMMWGDRLLDDSKFKYGEWESSRNNTAGAIEKIPKDIIICDWHYGKRDEYASVDYFLEKGFSVLSASWKNLDAAQAFVNYCNKFSTNCNYLGHICTTWVDSGKLSDTLINRSTTSGDISEVAKTTEKILKQLVEKARY